MRVHPKFLVGLAPCCGSQHLSVLRSGAEGPSLPPWSRAAATKSA